MREVRAKKNLGQHFLTDLGVARRIASTISEGELAKCPRGEMAPEWGRLPVVEIGPGMGVLTRFLLEDKREVVCVELDTESVEYLHRTIPSLDVREADFLQVNPSELADGPVALIGNYPYNISSQIFFRVLETREKYPVVAGMLQKEVAERICSAPGGKVYGILSVLLQAWYDCRYLFTVPPTVFSPPPKVQSGVLVLTRNSRESLGCDEKLFKRIVKTTFGQRRKTLRNSIRAVTGGKDVLPDDAMMSLRPERLSVDDFIRLTKATEEVLKSGNEL